MQQVFHAATTRGHANHGWLNSFHTFSFANYYQPNRMNFGALRVLNDDKVAAGMGFGKHPHSNMEIISIPLSGDLEHKDSMGNIAVIQEGDVQIMSAGTGIEHAEKNKSNVAEVHFLQLWIIPKLQNRQPRYAQTKIKPIPNEWITIVSQNETPNAVIINQDAWLSIGNFDENSSNKYVVHKANNGVYFFVLHGEIEIENTALHACDGLGIWDTNDIFISTKTNCKVLAIEVPMNY